MVSHFLSTKVAWVSGLPKGLGERKFFSLPSFPFSPETPDAQASTKVSSERRLKPGLEKQKKCPLPLNRGDHSIEVTNAK